MRPPPTMYLSWRVFLQGQVQFDVEAAIQCLYAKYEKNVGGLWHRIIPEMSDGVRACIQPPNSIICDAFSCYVAVDKKRLASINGKARVDGQTRYWRRIPIDFFATAMAA